MELPSNIPVLMNMIELCCDRLDNLIDVSVFAENWQVRPR